MADNQQLPPGAPQVSITLADKLGGQKQEPVIIDSNRVNPVAESRRLFLDALAIPGRFSDVMLQALSVILIGGLVGSVLKWVPLQLATLAPLTIVALVSMLMWAYLWVKFPELQLLLVYHNALLVIGLIVGGLL